MSEPISKRVRINNISMAGSPSTEFIVVSFIFLEGPQQFGGSAVVTRTELKRLNVTVGDELTLTLAALESRQ